MLDLVEEYREKPLMSEVLKRNVRCARSRGRWLAPVLGREGEPGLGWVDKLGVVHTQPPLAAGILAAIEAAVIALGLKNVLIGRVLAVLIG